MDVVTADALVVRASAEENADLFWNSEYLLRIEPDLCRKLIEHAADIRSPHSIVALFQIEGALNRIEAGRSATGNRDARYVVNLAGSWERPGDDKVNIAWAREAWSDIKPFSTGGSYINFLTEDESPERIAAALGKGLDVVDRGAIGPTRSSCPRSAPPAARHPSWCDAPCRPRAAGARTACTTSAACRRCC
jgi:hypothetical protein